MDEKAREEFETAIYAALEAGATIPELLESVHYCVGRQADV